MSEPLDGDQLLSALADAWRSAGRSKGFSWDADVALQSSLRRLISDVENGVGVVVDSEAGPALLVISPGGASLVRLTERGAETIVLGELVGGRFRETEERIDARHSAITMCFEHERIPGGFFEHHAVSAQQRDLQERVRPVLRRWSTVLSAR